MKGKLIVTNLQKSLFWETQELEPTGIDCMRQISVYPNCRKQVIHGFGGAFTESSAYNYQRLPQGKRKEFLQCYFGENGLRYNVGRVHLNSCDFSLGNYSCMDGSKDAAFHTERDEQYMIPLIHDAQKTAGEAIALLASPWSPPAFMKTNGDMNNGGKLKTEYRVMWAECMAKYVEFYRAKGCEVKMVTIQNEPAATQTWDSCLYSGKEEGEFALLLRKALDQAGCKDVRVYAWDHNKEVLVYRAEETMAVKGAQSAVDGFAVHWYTGDHFNAVRATKERWPDKDIWFTEGCVEYSRFDNASAQRKAEMYAHDMIGNLNAGISGSIDWNLLLDAQGGPNHVGNYCEAPVMLNSDGTDYVLMSEYYYIGHFSRYIKRGAVCLETSVWTSSVEVAAFEKPDGTRTAVVLNRSNEMQAVSLTDNAATGFQFVLEPHSIATLCWSA